MVTFQVQVSQNPYLPRGGDLVHAVVSVVSSTSPIDVQPLSASPLSEVLLLDTSGSMQGDKINYAKTAVKRAISTLREDAWFAIISGSDEAKVIYPMSQATAASRAAAECAVNAVVAEGGTAMSTWLGAALKEFRRLPHTIHHALLLTDGKNESETPDDLQKMLEQCQGNFQCDARGVGTDWVPDQLRQITSPLLGTVDIIPTPDLIEQDFRHVIASAMDKSVADVSLRVWTPMGAEVEFCRLVYPQNQDLTLMARTHYGSQVRDYPTGSWGEEKRDYHLAIRVKQGNVGQRMLAARVSLIVKERSEETKVSEAMMLAIWTDDDSQSAVIHPTVAHYTGQAELATAIQDGLKARAAGDEQRATALLGRAVQIAADSNPETMKLLRNVVQVEDEKQGTVRLIKGVRKEDEFALDTRSTRTVRVKK